MTPIPLIMPQLGESIAEATVIKLLVKVGDAVEADQDVMEVETSKATMTVTSPCRGRVTDVSAQLNESYPVGSVLGYLEVTTADAARLGIDANGPAKVASSAETPMPSLGSTIPPSERKQTVQPRVRGLPVPAHVVGASYMSPRMKAAWTNWACTLPIWRGSPAAAPADGSPSRISKNSWLTSKKTSSVRLRPCAWPWPTPCDEVGPARSPPS